LDDGFFEVAPGRRIGGVDGQCLLVTGDGFVRSPRFGKNIAALEVGEGVALPRPVLA
jgi:hypothetical protein